MTADTPDTMIAQLAEIVRREKEIQAKLGGLNINVRAIGISPELVEQRTELQQFNFNEAQIASFGRIVESHQRLVDGLGRRLASAHLNDPSLGEMCNAANEILRDYGEYKSPEGKVSPSPKDHVMRALMSVRESAHNSRKLLEGALEETRQQYRATYEELGPNQAALNLIDREREERSAMLQARTNRADLSEPTVIANELWRCWADVYAVRADIGKIWCTIPHPQGPQVS